MGTIENLRERAGVTQQALARAAGTSQPTIAAYEAGRKSPTLSTLRRLASAVGFEVRVDFHAPLTREERRSLFLHKAIAGRVSQDPATALAHARRTLGRMKEANPGAWRLLREWDVLLDRPLQDLIPVLTDPDPWARELRHVTPFAGVLPASERAAVYRAFAQAEGERL